MDTDSRFSHVATDPKFRRIPKSEKKVKIDKRFQSMFKDKKFKVKYTVDKRGRPINHTSSEDLRRYYELSSESDSESDSESTAVTQEQDPEVGKYVRSPDNEKPSLDQKSQLKVKYKTDKTIPSNVKQKLKDLKVDYARGESRLFSESSSESDDESDGDDSDTVEHAWGELDHDADQTEEATNRLAVCNMDWDRIRATDLMVLFNSFLPPGGVIKSVTIYPSEFGIKRMQEEEITGPIELVENKDIVESIEDSETTEGSKYHMEKLRQYQLNRLKYYYGIVVCDSVNTASKIYGECDGLEYESSSTKLDLRFVPDDMIFDQNPKEMCEKLPEEGKYQPRFFTTTALQQAKVDLTWDETDPTRIEITQKLASGNSEISEGDLQAYLASSSDSDSEKNEDEEKDQEEDEEATEERNKNPLEKYKSLLQEIEKKEEEKNKKDIGMEITWGIDLKEKTTKFVKEKLAKKEEKTPFEQYLEKRKEKRKEKRGKAIKNKDNTDSNNDSDDSLDVDMNDPYFADEFKNGDFRSKSKNKKPKSAENEDLNEQKKAELELLLLEEENDDKQHFSLKKIQEANEDSKKKRKNRKKDDEEVENNKDDNFQINVKDERFSALYTSHHFNLDPTDPHFKRTKAMELLVEEKLKRRNDSSIETNTENSKKIKKDSKLGTELNMLVKSVKQKTNLLNKQKISKIK